MIKTTTRWYCTLCGHGQEYNPEVTPPPIMCTACESETDLALHKHRLEKAAQITTPNKTEELKKDINYMREQIILSSFRALGDKSL